LWAYFAEHPEEGGLFNAAMVAKAHGAIAAIVAAYDFSSFDLIGDIGGGHGHLLQAVLDRAPSAKGVLFDQPHVIKEIADLASERLTLQAGDFFKDKLPACDAYLIMEVIHDWNDADSVSILKAIRRAVPPRAKLLLIETMVPDDPGPHWSKNLDVHMLTFIGGRQRTQQEYAALLTKASFSFKLQIDTPADISILEAVPADE
jgi:hypothetical protein